MKRPGLALALLLAAGLAAWMLGAGPLAAADATVAVAPGGNLRFDPATVTIDVGDQVSWTGLTGRPHTVTSTQAGLFDSSVDFGFRFTQPGTFDYFCQVHPVQMRGQVVVLGIAATSTPAPVPTERPGYRRDFLPLTARDGGLGAVGQSGAIVVP